MRLHKENGAIGQAKNPTVSKETIKTDICVIGAGSGGLSVAAAAAAFGRNVVLLEKHKMGGDCLNYGCVPSKALLAAGKRAHTMRSSAAFGIAAVDPQIDHALVNGHVRSVVASIEPNDSVERFEGLGVHVIQAGGKFINRSTVEAGGKLIKARRFVIATGSSPAVPPIAGLDKTPYFTNETLFDNDTLIPHLLIVGGGPIGMEMAQAHRRLGSDVTVIESRKVMGSNDPELAEVVIKRLIGEGVSVREGCVAKSVEGSVGSIRLSIETTDGPETLHGSHLLLAVGRKANIDGLCLEAAGIKHDGSGITVNNGMVTSNRKVFAIGDCVGGLQFTHLANYHAGIVIRRALFQLPAKVNTGIIPWVTFTDPELAHCGLSEEQAKARYGKITVLRWPYHENDRAQAERVTEGLVKVVTDKRGMILGASIVGEHAGELIQMWSLAISQKMKIKAMTDWISPYPTLSEVNKRAAYRYFSGAANNAMVRTIVNVLTKFG